MTTASQSSFGGLLVLAVKLGPKIAKVLIKAAKSATMVKTAGAAASVGLYTYLWTWEMAIGLIVFLLIHEYGHIMAMKHCGLKIRGVYLIPGFGAVAVSGERFGGALNEAYIAIMGPFVSFVVFCIPLLLLYFATGNQLWCAIASIMTFVNLLNLFPINPLDGGRIVKAILFSLKHSWGFFFMLAMFITAFVLGTVSGLTLIGLIAFLGLFELISDFKLFKALECFLRTFGRLFGITVGVVVYLLLTGDVTMHWFSLILTIIGAVVFSVMLVLDVLLAFKMYDTKNILMYPVMVVKELGKGVFEPFRLTPEDLVIKENYPSMSTKDMTWYSFSFVALALIHIAFIVYVATIPGSGLALELLK